MVGGWWLVVEKHQRMSGWVSVPWSASTVKFDKKWWSKYNRPVTLRYQKSRACVSELGRR